MDGRTQRSLAIFGMTSVAAFWVNALSHAWMLWRGHTLAREHRGTLQYRSALVGDAALLPLVNVMLVGQLEAWDEDLRHVHKRRGRLIRALLAGIGITAVFHIYQGAQKLTNWTMPRPWRWNALGYYHALYMAGQFTLLAYACAAAATRMRDQGSSALLTHRLFAASALLLAFAALLYKDYY
jgi:hypothetical protein